MDLIDAPEFAAFVDGLLKVWHVPGLAIAVVQNETIGSRGFGLANLDPPVYTTADTLFDIASSSKSLTAASVGLFAVDDVNFPDLQWNTPMSSLLPDDFVMSGHGYTEHVTVEDILSHRSGFPRHDFSYFGERSAQPDTPQTVTRNLRNLANAAPSRTRFLYSNVMYIVASWLVEVMSGVPFAEFLQQNIFGCFRPLCMNSTYLQPNAAIEAGLRDRMATPYVWDLEKRIHKAIPFIQAPEAQGCGSIFTSANDYIRWIRAIMNKEPPISEALYDGLVRPRIADDPEHPQQSWYGAGLGGQFYHGTKLLAHSGSVSGFGSIIFFIPEFSFGGVIFGNSGSEDAYATELANFVAIALIERALDRTKTLPDINGLPSVQIQHKTSGALETKTQKESSRRLNSEQAGRQGIPWSAYTGDYCNRGYRCMTVDVIDNELFVDATDRSEAFTLTFEHVCNGTIYEAHYTDYWEGGDEEIAAEFKFSDGEASQMGIMLEDELSDYIWFSRVPSLKNQ